MGEVKSFRNIKLGIVAIMTAFVLGFALVGAHQSAYADDAQYQAGTALSIQSNTPGTEVEAGSGASAADYTITDAASVAYTAAETSGKTASVPDTVTVNGVEYKVTSVSAGAFKGNTKLTKITVGKNVKTIGKNAFQGCAKLKSVTLGAAVTKIGAQAFKGDKKLKTVTINSKKLKKAGVKNAFKGSSVKTVKVPKAKVKAYKKIFTKVNCGAKVTVKAI